MSITCHWNPTNGQSFLSQECKSWYSICALTLEHSIQVFAQYAKNQPNDKKPTWINLPKNKQRTKGPSTW